MTRLQDVRKARAKLGLPEYTDPTVSDIEQAQEAEEVSKRRRTEAEAHRLGIIDPGQGVDPELVPIFAKISRLVGSVAVVCFVVWGNFYEWDFTGNSPFRNLTDSMRNQGLALLGLNAMILYFGWRRRFSIGVFIVAAPLKLLGNFFKSI